MEEVLLKRVFYLTICILSTLTVSKKRKIRNKGKSVGRKGEEEKSEGKSDLQKNINLLIKNLQLGQTEKDRSRYKKAEVRKKDDKKEEGHSRKR